jgi:hypothetical protein
MAALSARGRWTIRVTVEEDVSPGGIVLWQLGHAPPWDVNRLRTLPSTVIEQVI